MRINADLYCTCKREELWLSIPDKPVKKDLDGDVLCWKCEKKLKRPPLYPPRC